MAHRHATPLGDFPCFLGTSDEDLDGHVQLFEVICGAHEIVEDRKKLRIFPTTLRGDASEWYANLGMHKRTTYDDLKTNFLRKFRGLGFEEKLAEELEHLRQGPNKSIDKYIDRMNTIVRKLGNSAPDAETLKRRFLVGLHDEKVEQYIRLKRRASLDEKKHAARAWEEVQSMLRLYRDGLSLHSRSIEESKESTMFIDINEKKEEYRSKVQSKPRRKIIVNQGVPTEERVEMKSSRSKNRCINLGEGKNRQNSIKRKRREIRCSHNGSGVARTKKFSKWVNSLYEEIDRDHKGVAKCEQECHDPHDVDSNLEKQTLRYMWLCRMNPCFEKDDHFEADEHL
ncbi:hypothetical protein KP509_15G021400 [Ceratopteris richardii]|uniref:Retrotransposon gag domain-containing protein n=1 Tax=Ceratopteris richardii TaxID=49495 RepID=A0A8T2T5Y6_CERRI|nr:hypothetical protein KP509_15G021400 [Ceratopteris richardii]